MSLVSFSLGFIVLALCAAAAAFLRSKTGGSSEWPVYARPLMSEAEQALFVRLREALPHMLVFPQVQLCRFVEVRRVRGRMAVLNRYSRLSADFVICRADLSVERVIELDDRSHDTDGAKRRDAKKDAVLKAAGIEVIRIRARAIPRVGELRRLVFGERATGLGSATQPEIGLLESRDEGKRNDPAPGAGRLVRDTDAREP